MPADRSGPGLLAGGAASRFGIGYFLLLAIYGVVSPYLQILVRGLGYGPAAVGLFLGLYEIVGIAGPLVIGAAADANGRYRRILVFSCAMMILAILPLALMSGVFVTAVAISFFAIGIKSLIPLYDASVMTLVEPSRGGPGGMKVGYGLLRSMGSVGFVLVAVILQLIPGFDRSPPLTIGLWIMGTTSVFAASLAILPELNAKADKPRRGAVPKTMRMEPVFILGLVVIALNRFAMASIQSFFSLFVSEELHWNAVGGLWALAAVTEIPFLLVSGRLIESFGPMKVMAASTIAIAIRLAVLVVFPTPAGAVAGQLLHSACYGLFQPAAAAFVAFRYPPENRATGMALYMGFGVGLPFFAGSSIGGLIVEAFGYRVLFGSFIIFAVASLLVYRAGREKLDAVNGWNFSRALQPEPAPRETAP